jgi:hypothetical protein
VLAGAENSPPLVAAAGGGATAQNLGACVGDAVRPAGPADWGQLYRLVATDAAAAEEEGGASFAACDAPEGASSFAPEAGAVPAPLAAESARLWRRLPYPLRMQLLSCLEAPPVATEKGAKAAAAAAPPPPPPAQLIAAVERAAAGLAACSLRVSAGVALPVPIDLMAANINGYDLGLFAVAGEMPRAGGPGATEGRVLLDGTAECFPEGVDVDDVAAPLARSLYLRPLQRLHAAYGRETVLVYQTSTLRTDPSAILDAIFTELSVYHPTLDPVQGRITCRDMGWRGNDLADCDVRVPVMDDKVRAAIERVLAPYTAALKAYVQNVRKDDALPEGAQAAAAPPPPAEAEAEAEAGAGAEDAA